MKTEILMVTHKPIDFEIPPNCKKIQVNCDNTGERWNGYYHDNEGENISKKNGNYCELTALYWAWKNLDADIIGLCHYRRFFTKETQVTYHSLDISTEKALVKCGITNEQIEEFLLHKDVIVGMPYSPYPDDAYTDLCEYCYKEDIAILRQVIKEKYAEYYNSFEYVMSEKSLSYLNMMISKKEFINHYCEWLFGVLEEVEKICDTSEYDVQHKRIYGYFAEVLLNVYLHKNKVTVKYVRITKVLSHFDDVDYMDYIKSHVTGGIFGVLSKLRMVPIMNFICKTMRSDVYYRYIACKEKVEKNN